MSVGRRSSADEFGGRDSADGLGGSGGDRSSADGIQQMEREVQYEIGGNSRRRRSGV